MSRFLEHDAHALEVFASHSSLGRGSLSNCRASICSEVHSLTSLQKGVNLSKPFQPATVCLSKIHWNILKPPNRRFFFLDQSFWLLKFSNIDPLLHSHSGQPTRCQNFISSRWSAKIAPPVASRKKNTQLLHTGLSQGTFSSIQKTWLCFQNMIRRSLRLSLWDAGFGNRSLIHKNHRVWFFLSWSMSCQMSLYQTDNKVMKDKQIGHHQWFFGVAFWSTDGKLMVWIGGWGFNWGTLK